MMEWVYIATTWVIPVLLAITLHEAAHGFAAARLGDDTALRAGRVTLNPFHHVDPFGTIVLPALLLLMRAPFLFGWAKPVPVRFDRLRKPRRDMVLVAAAGPGVNILLAVISALLLHVAFLMPDAMADWTVRNLINSLQLNLVLAVFNMLPLPPLDGGRVAVGLLPPSLARPLASLERYGLLIIIGVLFLLPLAAAQAGIGLNILGWLIGVPVNFLGGLILSLTGVT